LCIAGRYPRQDGSVRDAQVLDGVDSEIAVDHAAEILRAEHGL